MSEVMHNLIDLTNQGVYTKSVINIPYSDGSVQRAAYNVYTIKLENIKSTNYKIPYITKKSYVLYELAI